MKLNYSKKMLIVSLVVFLVVFVLNSVFLNLLWTRIIGINDKVKQIDISTQEREREMILRDLIVNTKEQREKLASYFVGTGNADTVGFTEYLENQAKKTGVTQKKSLAYDEVKELGISEQVSAIRYKFNVSGNWTNVFNFLRTIENLPKVGYLNTVVFNANTDKTSGKIWSADLDFSVIKLNY
jgi:hypothetical protein